MLDTTHFSVAMSVYKNDDPINFDRALESITDLQTIKPTQINLVVDGPVPETINEVIKKFETKYSVFNIIRLKQNEGLGTTLQLAVEASTTELVARMDSDDVSLPNRFEQQLLFFTNNPQTDILGGDITEFTDRESHPISKRAVPCSDNEIKNYMKTRCAFNHVSVMFKKSAVTAAGGYQDWFFNEDYYLWIRMQLNEAYFANTGTVLVNVRVSRDMYNRRGGKSYFKSEIGLQKYMLENKVIGFNVYSANVIKRFFVQILLPNRIRGFVFRKLARGNV